MNQNGRQPRYQHEENPNLCIYVLIAINIIFFLAIPQQVSLYARMALSPMGIKAGLYWQIISSMFMHGGFFHLFFNMWGLYLFGTLIAPHLKTARFLILYFAAGICGNLLWLGFNWNAMAFVVGASGALFGVLIATAMLEPDRQFILLLFPVPMKAKTLVAAYAIIEILSVSNTNSSIAHLVHVGGLITGYLYIRIFCRQLIIWDPLSFLMPKGHNRFKNSSKGWTIHNFTGGSGLDFKHHVQDPSAPVSRKELDYLLDKVSREGINSLSDEEMATLRKAREQMRNR